MIQCMRHCIEMTMCMSYSFNTDSSECTMFDVVYGSGEKGTPKINTQHYNIGENGKCWFLNCYIYIFPCVNPLVTSGFSHSYHLGEPTFIFRGIRSISSFFISFFDEKSK